MTPSAPPLLRLLGIVPFAVLALATPGPASAVAAPRAADTRDERSDILLTVANEPSGPPAGAHGDPAPPATTLAGHDVVLDASEKLLSWVQPQDQAYATVVRLAFEQLLDGFPVETNGLPTWLAYCCFDGQTRHGTAWPHNPACVYAGLVQGAAAWHAFSGDRRVIDLVRRLLDYQLANGTTPADAAWEWPSVPYASSDPGAVRYRGAHDFLYAEKDDLRPRLGRGDGYGVIEPDKVGELGLAYLTAWKLTEDLRYRDAALACARALARHVRSGDAERSPWPFRVVAETGVAREEYCASLGSTLRLFDELERLGIGEVGDWRRARGMAWAWLEAYPFRNDVWANYFEDLFWIPKPTNLNQYDAAEMARYLVENEDRDPEWRDRAGHLLEWVERTFGQDTAKEKGVQWGAVTVSEQVEYTYKMGSHTSRFASVLAEWSERTGDPAAREKAFRSFNWASYMCDRRGVVRVGPVEASHWFSDGYGDYVRHFMAGMGAVPEWAPRGEDHLLRSSSVVPEVAYEPRTVRYRTFDAAGEEVLRLSFEPSGVTVDGRPLSRVERGSEGGWGFDPATGVLRVRRSDGRRVTIEGAASPRKRVR
jgi:hypothetical protein